MFPAQAWIEGIKDIMEALIILIMAWALGAAVQVELEFLLVSVHW